MDPFTLYKVHENTDCEILQNITRYIHFSSGISIFPSKIVERYIPESYILPTIVFENGTTLKGLPEVVSFLEMKFGLSGLVANATAFAEKNPSYRIRDVSTHKNLK